MDAARLAELSGWVTEAGLAGKSEIAILEGFCQRAIASGLPVARAMVVIDTLHPIYEGRVFRWRRDSAAGQTEVVEYGPTSEGELAESWRRSSFYYLLETGGSALRRRLGAGDAADFPAIAELQAQGITDYLALINRFAAAGVIGEMDCVYSYWATDHTDGFDDRQVDALATLMPKLALAIKCVSLARIAETLVETYLGRAAGRRVLAGRISRSRDAVEQMTTALWYSDLRDFTRITDRSEPAQIIPFLNDYADAVISAVHQQDGDVVKLIGDGVLAIFTGESTEAACVRALAAEAALRDHLAKVNNRRGADGLPTTEAYLGLHVGEVFYGNIGSKDRLDFTVVGPAVNEVSRIGGMCRSVDRGVLVSEAFAAALPQIERSKLVSVGRYALRGVERPQHLYTIDNPLASGLDFILP
jgi:adenylate cyclase